MPHNQQNPEKDSKNERGLVTKPKFIFPFRAKVRASKNPRKIVSKQFKKDAKIRLKRIKKQLKKKVSLFYKFSFFFFLLSFVTIFYFVVMVSVAPKSFPFVTQKIQTYLQNNIDKEASIEQSHLRFTRYGTLNIAVDELKIFYKTAANKEKQKFIIPRLEAEISIFDLLRLKITPSKIRIIDAQIVINNQQDGKREVENIVNKEEQSNLIASFIKAIREQMLPIENFEINNASFVIKGKESEKRILVKRSNIRSRFSGGAVTMHSVNRISFDSTKPDVNFNANCKLERKDAFKCGLLLDKFETASIADIHAKLNVLNKVDASFNVMGSFVMNAKGIQNFIFTAEATKGSFEAPDFFSKRMEFANFSVSGEYHNDLGVFNLSQIQADFPNAGNVDNMAHLDMSFVVSNLHKPQEEQSNFDIKLHNVLSDEVDKFWPIRLNKAGVRDWVIEHITGGIITDAYAKFTLNKEGDKTQLQEIDSQLVLSGSNLNYSDKFPAITQIKAVASFTKSAMKIAISDAKVLDTSISDASVEIKDFQAAPAILNISGKSNGYGGDALKHASNNAAFRQEVDKNLNGKASNQFDVDIPLTQKPQFKDVRIEVKSEISNVQTDYVKGTVKIDTKKSAGSSDFITKIALTNAQIEHKAFDIEKKLSDESGINLILSLAKPQQVRIKDFLFWKKKPMANGKNRLSEIAADMVIQLDGSGVSYLQIDNRKFGDNNYSITYEKDQKQSKQSLVVKALDLDLEGFLQKKKAMGTVNKSANKGSNKKPILYSDYSISVKNLMLAHNKSINDFSLSLECDEGVCHSGFMIGNYNNKDFLSLKAKKVQGKNASEIYGKISNIGYLSDALGISEKISSNEVNLAFTHSVQNGQQVFQGSVTADKGLTIFENETVKRLAKDTLFNTVKDKIFSSNKIVFDAMKANLLITDKVITIESFVANNYKIGITAKGELNLGNNSYDIKGMIIPGFIVNNLFGIGNVPVVGTVVSEVLTGGNKGGGLFGIHYEYWKAQDDQEAQFKTNKISAFVPTTIRNLFDKI